SRLIGVAESSYGSGRPLYSIAGGEIVGSPLTHRSNSAENAGKPNRATLLAELSARQLIPTRSATHASKPVTP
ncbi:MAG: hypothetical protein WBM63_16560, partial [Sedimenticolaceae bacterium]